MSRDFLATGLDRSIPHIGVIMEKLLELAAFGTVIFSARFISKFIGLQYHLAIKPYMGEKPANWKALNLTSGNFEPWDYQEKNIEA